MGGHTRTSKIFSSGRLFFRMNNAIHVKLKISVETRVCQEHFILEKESLQKPLRRMEYFSLVFVTVILKFNNQFKKCNVFLLLQDNLFFSKYLGFFLLEMQKSM